VAKTLVEQYVEDPVHMRLFQQERAVYEVTELIEAVMAELGISRSQLAAKLGRSKGWITQLLDGDRNKTIRTVADVLAVMGREFRSSQRPIQIQKGEQASAQFEPLANSTGLRVVHGDDYQAGITSEAEPRSIEAKFVAFG
jgi:transcriptional regulator with XRE-family HTH domain